MIKIWVLKGLIVVHIVSCESNYFWRTNQVQIVIYKKDSFNYC